MTHESGDSGHHYDENGHSDDYQTNPSMFNHYTHRLPGRRRRTFSENAIEEEVEKRATKEAILRRRAKSGDDSKKRYNSPHGNFRSRSGNLFWRSPDHNAEDMKPLLSHKVERVCIDTIAQVVRCTSCNCTHSDTSSCDTPSGSSHCQSCEKICHSNGQPCFTSMQKGDFSDDDLNLDTSTYGHINELVDMTYNGERDLYDDNHLLHHRHVAIPGSLPPVYSNGHIPQDREQIHMLLEEEPEKAGQVPHLAWKKPNTFLAYFGLIILAFANTLNYMDRYTIAGVLIDVKDYYNIQNNEVGLLQTSFIISYMVFSPIFGYMGDRYSRKWIMAVGIFFWSIITLASSFIPADRFWVFLLMRGLVGIGEASYSTIAPTIIADLYVGVARTKALSVFYFAIPVGSGLGYIAGSKFAEAMGSWQWALRITPGLGIVCVVLILLVVREPQRGAAEGNVQLVHSSWTVDIMYLFKHKSFMLSSAGFTCVAFIAGAMALWTPTYMYYSIRQQPASAEESNVSMIFGIITCASGFTGVALGSWSASKLRGRWKSRADPIVCAFGLIGCAPFLFAALYMSREYTLATWVLIFIGETLLSLNWAIVTDILLYIVVPNRRATAEAVQILMSHALGDAGSPYLVGQIADMVSAKDGFPQYRAGQYLSLQYSMYMCCFVAVLGGGFFLLNSLYIEEDKNKVDAAAKALPKTVHVICVDGEAGEQECDECPATTDLTSPQAIVT